MTVAASVAGAEARETDAPSRRWAIAGAVAMGAVLEIIDTSILNVALPQIQATLGATLSQVSWVVTSYAIANVIILPLAAWLSRRFGRKRYFLFSLFGFTAASLLCGMSTSLPMLVVARLLQGLTGGGLISKAQSILLETFPREEHPKAQAFFGAIVVAGPAIGPTLGGYLVTHHAWQWVFFINLPLGVLAFVLVAALLPEDDLAAVSRDPVDWPSLALLALGLGCLQTFLEEGNAEGWWASGFIRGMAIGAAAGLALFVGRALRSPRPIVDLRVLRHRSLAAGSTLGVVVGATLYGALFAIPVFAQTQLHYTSQDTGLLLLPGAIASAIGFQLAGKVARSVDTRAILLVGMLGLVCALLWLGTVLGPVTGAADLFWPLILRSLATVFMYFPLQLAALGSLPHEEIPAATGLFNLIRQLGGSLGIAVLTWIVDERTDFHRAMLVEHIVPNEALTLERVDALTRMFLEGGFDPETAVRKGTALLDLEVSNQASILAFSDTFTATAALVLVSLPLVLLFGAPKAATAPR